MTSHRTPTEVALTLFQVYPISLDAAQRHEQAVAQVAAMDPRVASEVYQQMLNSSRGDTSYPRRYAVSHRNGCANSKQLVGNDAVQRRQPEYIDRR